MKRRDFLAAASSCLLPLTVNGFTLKAVTYHSSLWQSATDQTTPYGDRILVMIYLKGGNDGLNTVIPLNQLSAYNALRGNIAIPDSRILPLTGTGTVGLHPALTGLRDLYNNGKVSIIHSVGYPDADQSHQRSANVWMTAMEPGQAGRTGWIGRYLENRFPNYPANYPSAQMKDPLAVQIGSLNATALLGSQESMGIAFTNPTAFSDAVGSGPAVSSSDWPCCDTRGQISFVRRQQLATGYAGAVKRAADAGKNLAAYPLSSARNELADQLKIVARLIHGGLQTKVYLVTLDGFDTHAGQVDKSDTTQGVHASLLTKLSTAVSSFQQDLKLLGIDEKVIGMTFSEFGRRANSNASTGTDHGMAAPMFVFGANVRHPTIGAVPDLSALSGAGINKDVPMQIDFRQVYSDILNDWFGTARSTTDTLLLRNFPTISLFSSVIETIASGDWADSTTWSVGRVPYASEYVRINPNHVVTIGQTVTAKSIDLQGKINFVGKYSVKLTG